GHHEMIGDVETDVREIDDRFDADAAQPVGRTDPRTPQQHRVLYDTGAQHHIASAQLLTIDELDADRALLLDHDAAHVCVAPHDQMSIGPCRLEVEQQVGLTQAFHSIHRN